MCTAMTLQSVQGENFFGRTMDFSHPIEPGIYIMPRNYQWHSQLTRNTYTNQYGIICLGQETDGMLGLFDGVNEQGFAAAALYFDGHANYNLPVTDQQTVASLDFLHFILGYCSSVENLKVLLQNICIVGLEDPITRQAAPLHWIVTDRSGNCAVVEQTDSGLEVIDNPIGVMTNSPDFRWHMTNLRNYMNLSITQDQHKYWGGVSLRPFGQGSGTTSLPGGFTSPERFVRTAFLKTHTLTPDSPGKTMMACFHIMNSVFIPKGIVLTDQGTHDYTKYVTFINTNTCEYYFKTYNNPQIMTASLGNYDLQSSKPIFLGKIEHT